MLNLNALKNKIVRGKNVYERISLATLKSKTINKLNIFQLQLKLTISMNKKEVGKKTIEYLQKHPNSKAKDIEE